MHIATRRGIIGLNEGTVYIDHLMTGVTYRPAVSTAEAFNL